MIPEEAWLWLAEVMSSSRESKVINSQNPPSGWNFSSKVLPPKKFYDPTPTTAPLIRD